MHPRKLATLVTPAGTKVPGHDVHCTVRHLRLRKSILGCDSSPKSAGLLYDVIIAQVSSERETTPRPQMSAVREQSRQGAQ